MFSQLIAECRDEVIADLVESEDSPPKFKSQLRDRFMPKRHRKRLKAHSAAVRKHRDDAEQAKSTAFIGKLRADREKEKKAQHARDYHPDAVRKRRNADYKAADDRKSADRERNRKAAAEKYGSDRVRRGLKRTPGTSGTGRHGDWVPEND